MDSPSISNITETTPYETSFDIAINQTYNNYVVTAPTHPKHGKVLIADYIITYVPNNGYFGLDTFFYQVTYDNGTSAKAMIIITVDEPPPAPIARDYTATILYNASTDIDILSFGLIHNYDPTDIIDIHTMPSHGYVTFFNNIVSYIIKNYSGDDPFTYIVTDIYNRSSVGTITVKISLPPPFPVARNYAISTPYATATSMNLFDLNLILFSGNDSIAISQNPIHGDATFDGTTITYTPKGSHNFMGFNDIIKYSVIDEYERMAIGTISVSVLSAPPAPKATPYTTSTKVKTSVSFDILALNLIIYYLPTDTITISKATHGKAILTNSSIQYTPTNIYTGHDAFDYTVTDIYNRSSTATISITTDTPPKPIAHDYSVSTSRSIPTSIDLIGLYMISNYVKTDAITISTKPLHGTVGIRGTIITYTPDATYTGSVTIKYTVTDIIKQTATGSIIISIYPPITVRNFTFSVYNTSSISQLITEGNISNNVQRLDFNVSADTPAHGTVSISYKTITYTPHASYIGSDTFIYKVTLSNGQYAKGTFSISVLGTSPIATDFSGSLYTGTTWIFNLSSNKKILNYLSSDVITLSSIAYGSASFSGATITYISDSKYYGEVSFYYTVTDIFKQSSTGKITLTISPKPTPKPTPTPTPTPSPAPKNGLYSWGLNDKGQLGLGDTTNRSSPTQIGANTWSIFSAGGSHSILGQLVDSNGSNLYSCGDNKYGQLGLGDTTNRSSPTQIGSLSNWATCECGENFSIIVTTDGKAFTFGNNTYGQLGLGDTTSRASPVQLGSLAGWSIPFIGQYHTILSNIDSTKKQTTTFAFGANTYGQLGLGDTDNRSSPSQIGSTNWALMPAACGISHTIFIDNAGKIYSCGDNQYGQLGLGDTDNRSSPTQIGSQNNWEWAYCAGNSTFLLDKRGYVYACGDNSLGQLGLGDTSNRSLPSQISLPPKIGAFQDFWSSMGSSKNSGGIITRNCRLFTFGDNQYGQLSLGNTNSNNALNQVNTYPWWRYASNGCGNHILFWLNS